MRHKISYTSIFIILFLLAGSFSWALEVREGRIKLILHEGTGRFSLYYLSDLNKKKYIPFFVDQDPRTSVMSLLADNRIYKLGESSIFQEKAEKTASGAKFSWISTKLEIDEIFTPVTSSEAALPDGVKIEIKIKNLSEQSFNIGLRFLLDTYLGEESYIHFKTDRSNQIVKETTITKNNMINYWVSPKEGDPDQFGLQSITKGKGITTPDSIVFANWKRLNDSSWSYETNMSRNFSLLPYSINDSAVCQYYNPEVLDPNKTRKIVIVLGKYDPNGYDISNDSNKRDLTNLLKKAVSSEGNISDMYLSAQADLSTVNTLLDQINDSVKSYKNISGEKIDFIEEILNRLKEKSKKYSQ